MQKRKFYLDGTTNKVTPYTYHIQINTDRDIQKSYYITSGYPDDFKKLLLEKYSFLSTLDITSSEVSVSSSELDRLSVVNSLIENVFDVITNIGEISDFIETAYISDTTNCSILKSLQKEYKNEHQEVLLEQLKSLIKEYRKEMAVKDVIYKNKTITTDDKTIKSLTEIYFYLEQGLVSSVSYKFEDGSFQNNVTLEDIKEILKKVSNYVQSVWKAEELTVKHYTNNGVSISDLRDMSYKNVFNSKLEELIKDK